MTLTPSQAAAGAGGVGVGVIAAELTQQGIERDVVSPIVGGLAATGVGVGAAGLALADLAGLVRLPAGTAPFLGGVATGAIGWSAGRAAGIAPRIVVGVPEDVDITAPLISAAVISTLLLGIESGRKRLL